MRCVVRQNRRDAVADARPSCRYDPRKRSRQRIGGCTPRSLDDDAIVRREATTTELGRVGLRPLDSLRSLGAPLAVPVKRGPATREPAKAGESSGAEERTRTFMGLRPLAPEASASAKSATSASGAVSLVLSETIAPTTSQDASSKYNMLDLAESEASCRSRWPRAAPARIPRAPSRRARGCVVPATRATSS